MNFQEYINSGIIERYALDNVSPQERQEIECMSHIYPEIKHELMIQQKIIEQLVMTYQVAPPVELKSKILVAVKNNLPELSQDITQGNGDSIVETTKTNVIKMTSPAPTQGFYKYLAAASIAFCIGLGGMYLKNNYEYKEQLSALNISNSGLEEQMNSISQKLAIIENPNFQKITLPGIKDKSPESVATVYWNKGESTVYLTPNSLPKPSSGKQFQLWAIKDGAPVDIGMLPNNFDSTSLIKMTNIDDAQAFAITMEKEGGVPSPTMSEMYVMAAL
ncbi:MAG TPA: anti-sigma factor [Saprospiraceae bacterium]|nr:anti-sigma factor [Saprospiraceae bacterium]HQW54810.1 anti-sigma factor [Saprospiraceae bacterium]